MASYLSDSQSPRIKALQTKRDVLKSIIKKEKNRVNVNDYYLKQLQKQNLNLKDEITVLNQNSYQGKAANA